MYSKGWKQKKLSYLTSLIGLCYPLLPCLICSFHDCLGLFID